MRIAGSYAGDHRVISPEKSSPRLYNFAADFTYAGLQEY